METRPFVYVCSPLRGDIKENINKAIGYARFVYTKGSLPLAPHVIFTQFLNDEISEERKAGMEMGIELLNVCDELWAFGNRISDGMAAEMIQARKLGLTVKRFDDRCNPLEVVAGDAGEE